MATVEDMNQKRIQDQMAKENRIRNIPFTDLNREDALLRMFYMQKDLTMLNKSNHDLSAAKKSMTEQMQEIACKTTMIFDTLTTLPGADKEALETELEKRLVAATGWRKLKPEEKITHYDRITANFTGFAGDEPQPNMSGRNTTFELNYQNFIIDLEAGFVGMGVGEFKVIQATFPENYHAKDMSNKTYRFDLEVLAASRNVKIEQMMVERDQSERQALLTQLDEMKMRPENAEGMTTDQLRADLAELKKEFADKQKNADGVIHSAQPPAVGEMDVLPDAVH